MYLFRKVGKLPYLDSRIGLKVGILQCKILQTDRGFKVIMNGTKKKFINPDEVLFSLSRNY